VPFAGFVGDYQSIQVLTDATFGLPLLVDQNFNDATSFTLAGGDLPNFLVHFEHQSRLFRMEAFDALTGRSVGSVLQLDYMVRNSTSTGFFAFAWDGTTTRGRRAFTVPNGQYIFKVSVLKALGNSWNPRGLGNLDFTGIPRSRALMFCGALIPDLQESLPLMAGSLYFAAKLILKKCCLSTFCLRSIGMI